MSDAQRSGVESEIRSKFVIYFDQFAVVGENREYHFFTLNCRIYMMLCLRVVDDYNLEEVCCFDPQTAKSKAGYPIKNFDTL